MKHFIKLFLLTLLVSVSAFAQDNISIDPGPIGNGRLLGAKTYDGQTTVGVLGVDSASYTKLDSLSSKGIKLNINGTTEATLTNDQLQFSGANFQIVGGSSTVAFRDSTDSQNNFLIDETGYIQPLLDLVFRSGRTISIQEATAGAKCMGSATANGTTAVTVSTTCATTGSRIFLTRSSAPSGTAQCWQTNIVNATSFDLDCSGAETGTFDWMIVHEAP